MNNWLLLGKEAYPLRGGKTPTLRLWIEVLVWEAERGSGVASGKGSSIKQVLFERGWISPDVLHGR